MVMASPAIHTVRTAVVLIALLAPSGCASPDAQSAPESSSSLRPVATIVLPNVSGRIDHLAFDAATHRLFIAALGNDTIEVVDTASARHLRSVPGFHEPQGIAFDPDAGGLAIANGGSGTLQFIDAGSLQTRWTTNIGGDADNVRYDASARRVYVAAQGGIAAVSAAGQIQGRIEINGHPESFQLDPGGSLLFANLPGASQVVVGNRASMNIRNRWRTGDCRSNYPMALDAASHRVFIGCRQPASLAVIDTESGKVLGSVPVVGDTDDLFYDAMRQRLYVIGGEGFVDVVQRTGDALRRTSRVTTRAGARTGLWVPQEKRLYVAVPARRGESAEIRVFEAAE
jgi:DNA-binding beta-propeller fold protein YncE